MRLYESMSLRKETKRVVLNLELPTMILIVCFGIVSAGEFNLESIVKVQKELRPLKDWDAGEYPDSVEEYFKYYGLDPEKDGIEHIFGTFESEKYILTGHIFRPEEYKATVILVHGFGDHCGQMRHLIYYLLNEGYCIAGFDLPGYGLSSGERAVIDDFSKYSTALKDFARVTARYTHGPYHVIGHSTGGAAILDYLVSTEEFSFDKIILAAPLVRNVAWGLSKVGFFIARPFSNNIPRKFRKNSSDKEFLDFIKNKDPLQVQSVSLKWTKALYKWNDRIADLPVSNKEIFVIQGKKDTTVAWKYNIKFIKGKFSNTKVMLVKDGRHQLLNESADLRNDVFSNINRYLKD